MHHSFNFAKGLFFTLRIPRAHLLSFVWVKFYVLRAKHCKQNDTVVINMLCMGTSEIVGVLRFASARAKMH